MTTNNTNALLAIIVIGILAIVAMYKDIDGNLMLLCVAAIAGLGGYELYKREKAANTGV